MCLILGDNEDNGAGVTMEAVGDNWPNAFRSPNELHSGSHKGVLPHSPRQFKNTSKTEVWSGEFLEVISSNGHSRDLDNM